jgi:hypothetical protein
MEASNATHRDVKSEAAERTLAVEANVPVTIPGCKFNIGADCAGKETAVEGGRLLSPWRHGV